MKPQWKHQAERSNAFWILFLLRLGTVFGRKLTRLALPFIVGYFLIFPGESQRHSRRYLQRVLQRPPRLMDVARHFHCFASSLLDRLFLYTGRDDYFQVSNPDAPLFDELAKNRTGAILMISHVGSFDILRLAVKQRRDDLRLRVLMDLSQGATLNEVLKSLNPEFLSSIIDTSQCQGTDLILRIREELDAGSVIGIMADRLHQAEERSLQANFLGLAASIPAGPWLIANVMKVPVYMGLGLYQGDNRYHLHFEKLFDGGQTVPRKQRDALIQQRAQHYLQRLQEWVQRYPYNWFNYYDFWAQLPDQDQNDATTS